MAYTKTNKLKRIIDVQNLYQEHKKEGVTHVWVYNEKIYPIYRISMSTLDKYLQTPAVKLLKEMDETAKNKTPFIQTSMGFDEPISKDNGNTGTSA